MLTRLRNRLRNGLRRNAQRLARLKKVFWQLEQLPDVFNQQAAENSHLKHSLHLLSKSFDWLVESMAQTPLPMPRRAPLVSVIMPTWNRVSVINNAIDSLLNQTYTNWECLIIDDGSTDDTVKAISHYLRDPRFRLFHQYHQNAAVARNLGLANADGEIVAYLDTDNLWLPNYLTAVVTAFVEDDSAQTVFAAQIVKNPRNEPSFIRGEPFNYQRLLRENFIDLNVFAHRIDTYRRLGGFDERLDSLQDWDLILRYTQNDKVKRLPVAGGIYLFGADNQISDTVPHAYSRYLIQTKFASRKTRPLKVLYALWHYPQLSESYVRWELQAVLEHGIEVEVWSEEGVAAPFESEVPIHRGSLESAIARFQPDIVHTHWLDYAHKLSPIVERAGLPMTARGHGFEFSPGIVEQLNQNSTIKAMYLFPHQAARIHSGSRKIKTLSALFHPALYPPNKKKDRRMVLRTGCALPSKDYISFIKAALLCPDHRFLLNLCQAYQVESYLDTVLELNRSFGNPVEIVTNLQHEEVAELMQQAGIYLHTLVVDGPGATPFGMPISICEAMATGSYILGRRCPGSPEYIGDAGAFYDTPEEAAALIKATQSWNEEQWNQAYKRSVNRAYRDFINTENVQSLIADWEEFSSQKVTTGFSANGR